MPRGLAGKVDPNGRKVRLPDEADAMLVLRAMRAGKSPGEYLRDLVMVHLYGADELLKVQQSYLTGLARSRPD